MTRVCVWCGKEIGVELLITDLLSFKKANQTVCCENCLSKFNRVNMLEACLGCAKPSEQKWCKDCAEWKKMYPQHTFNHQALFEYNSFAKEWIKRVKFLGDIQVGSLFCEELKKELKVFRETHIFVPIPVSAQSLKERGFNQLHVVLDKAAIRYEELLINTGTSGRQSQKNREERLATKQPFEVIKSKQERIRNKKILLIDDVYTTGRTMLFAVERLRESGADSVQTFSFFR